MTERQWFNVGAVKLPEAERDLAASVFAGHPERFYDVLGADTVEEDDRFPVGSHTAYSALLTEEQAETFSRASNARYVEPNQYHHDVKCLSPLIPRPRSQRYLEAEVAAYPSLTGTGIPIANIDEGTTAAARAEKNVTLLAKAYFLPNGEPNGEIWSPSLQHGCLTMGNGVPYGGQVLDALAIDQNGGADDASIASAITWSLGQGARVINISLRLPGGSSSVVNDALVAGQSQDVAIMCAAGNDNARGQVWPALANTYLSYVHSIMSIDMSLNQRSSFSNYGPWHTGTAPGELVYTTTYDGSIAEWYGTSAACPHVTQMVARIMSAGVSAKQAAAALAASVRDVGLGEGQGGGLYSMSAALRWLNKEPPIAITRPARPQTGGLPLW